MAAQYRCRVCEQEKPESEYRTRLINGDEYRLKTCIDCERADQRERYHESREERIQRQREYRKRMPKEVRDRDNTRKRKRYKTDPKYRKRRKVHARERYYKKNPNAKRIPRERVLGVNLPSPVVAPVLAHLKEQYDGGIEGMGESIGVDSSTLGKILTGKRAQVSIDVADRIVLESDWRLDELYDRAEEWAQLTGDSWPEGYQRTRLV